MQSEGKNSRRRFPKWIRYRELTLGRNLNQICCENINNFQLDKLRYPEHSWCFGHTTIARNNLGGNIMIKTKNHK
ncbi:hypothetical protein BST85_13915 [Aureitalea marina]|uniref:Uncharacterized protein n=1 Tax=Aureitalea marina TaxID=930804 RepID=A0A2S7KTC7_9FLAO|nr:hypothetical protein BST85_13915 [Aureitalea marina]